ncbi:MerR family transcriptional regulator [Amycolatopsis endophytica]|uniref:DNA-binding transcriptional MerR regulator n=1 Tax=Amycolatopsis endophytica TaxID=860233 RepID=A0A853BAE9_9PSEU|nr:MerR family transcriptional regulator [Amycolatopsis endophytica]NYI92328.1 DNA-binding transcriptional MerR regulator [Amycolatopsis endophytica]
MRIGEIARRSGVSVRALRYYEEQELIVPGRGPGGQREYTEDAIHRVRVIQQLYAAGLPSRRIAELLPCLDTDTTTDHQRAMLHAERDRISAKIEQLTAALGRLDAVIKAADERRTAAHPTAGPRAAEHGGARSDGGTQ